MRHVALLRAINIGPHNRVGMGALRDLFTELGFTDPRTLLQSGNIVFGSNRQDGSELERLAEGETARRLGVSTEFFIRTAKEWGEIVAGNPFPTEAELDPGHLLLLLLKEEVGQRRVQELQAAISGRERVRGSGRHVYVSYPDGVGRSRLTIALIEKKLGTRSTGRNWNTVLKLNALLQD